MKKMKFFDELQKEQDRKKVKQLIRDIDFIIKEKRVEYKKLYIEKNQIVEDIESLRAEQKELLQQFKDYWKEEL